MRLIRYMNEAIKSKMIKGLYGKVRVIEGYKNHKRLYVHKKGKHGYMVTDTEKVSLDNMIKIGNEFWFGTLKELHTALNERKKLADYYNTPPVQKKTTELEENMLLELIHKECKPWMKEIGNFGITTVPNPVFRGVEQSIRLFRKMKGTRRSDRAPKLTQKEVFEIYDKAFADRFGWWVRSKGIFTGSEYVSDSYGIGYVFFPMGKYRYVWSAKYSKVWHNLTSPGTWELKSDLQKKAHLVDQEQIAKEAVRYYKDRNIKGAMKSEGVKFEAIFECKQYLLINNSMYIGISNRI